MKWMRFWIRGVRCWYCGVRYRHRPRSKPQVHPPSHADDPLIVYAYCLRCDLFRYATAKLGPGAKRESVIRKLAATLWGKWDD